ncbi:hypothetical protein ADEAN_000085600 [Angomonas deanei]|uniref:Uncharacterized protein n=1 Tax=Angomonas deanei TaxID=59799 RepID=A0A7G2C1K8_9TRYP|nr:hypothetical protein ADEAN_000085600 [Angomonas deanei]
MLENDPFARSERQRREKAAVQVIESQYEKYRRSKERAVLSQYLTQGEDSTDVVIYLQLYALYTRSEPRDREWVCLEEEAQFARLREMYINGI